MHCTHVNTSEAFHSTVGGDLPDKLKLAMKDAAPWNYLLWQWSHWSLSWERVYLYWISNQSTNYSI